MQTARFVFFSIALAAVLALSGCADQAVAAETAARASGDTVQSYSVSDQLAPGSDKNGPDKAGKEDKDNNGKKANNTNNGNKNGKGQESKGKSAQGNGPLMDRPSPAGKGLGAWWRDFSSRVLGNGSGVREGGWQLGRFKDAFPFAYPPGWAVSQRGDAALVTGAWQGGEYVFQMTRTTQVQAESLEDWVAGDLKQLGLTGANVQYAEAERVRIAVVSGVKDAGYECPVAYVYMWAANPAGNNQRQARGIISQAPGSTCDPGDLNAFVGAYLAEVKGSTSRSPEATSTPSPSVWLTVTPTATRAPASGWQQTRFFNAFSFAYPTGWSMDRLGDTAHLQGDYEGRAYVTDMVWVRDLPGAGLEQWARADLRDLGVNMDGRRIDYLSQGNEAQIAVVSGIPLQGYQCPVVRIYVLADNTATTGQRAYIVTVAQANGQPCNLQALENLAYTMLRQP